MEQNKLTLVVFKTILDYTVLTICHQYLPNREVFFCIVTRKVKSKTWISILNLLTSLFLTVVWYKTRIGYQARQGHYGIKK